MFHVPNGVTAFQSPVFQRSFKRKKKLSESSVFCLFQTVIISKASPVFRSGLIPPEGASGRERGLWAGPGCGVAQAAVLVRHGGWSATAGAQGITATHQVDPVCVEVWSRCLWDWRPVFRWWTCPALWRWRCTLLRSSYVSIATWRSSQLLSSAASTPFVSCLPTLQSRWRGRK